MPDRPVNRDPLPLLGDRVVWPSIARIVSGNARSDYEGERDE